MNIPTSSSGSPLVVPGSTPTAPLPGTQPQPATRPPLPGVNAPNPPSLVADPQPPRPAAPAPADWNAFAALAAAVFDALAKGGPDAAQRLLDWAKAENAKK